MNKLTWDFSGLFLCLTHKICHTLKSKYVISFKYVICTRTKCTSKSLVRDTLQGTNYDTS